jgi:hypothetical protein
MPQGTKSKDKATKSNATAKAVSAHGSFVLKPAGRKVVEHHDAPPPYERRERIHPRRILRRVKEGKEREFHSATREVVFDRPMLLMAGAAQPATEDLALKVNSELTQPAKQQLASNVGEPSVSANGDVVFYTGNWYAARSVDGGRTFTFIDPFKSFPDPPNLGFCCDQVVNYIPSIDTFVWLLQYGPNQGPDQNNIQRLAFAKTEDVKKGKWRLFDITTKALGVPGMFLDFPDLAVGAKSLYVTTNIFTAQGRGAGAAVVRIPFASIDKPPVKAAKFVRTDLDSFRVAQNCGSRAFFAAHQDTSTLAVFTWDESAAQPQQHAVPVARWISGNGFHSRTPDGRTWLDRADNRMTGATLAGHELYFAWGVDVGSNQRPQPFVQLARVDANNLTLLENINVFDSQSATCYGALSTNADGEVGISYMIGGGPRFPTHVVGILTGTRKDLIVSASDRGPLPDPNTGLGEWGDYLTVRPYFPDQKLFAATGYTMKGATGSNRQCTPRFVIFGRASVAGAAPAVTGPGAPAPAPGPVPATPPPAPPIPASHKPTPPQDGTPITDVNTLPTVSAAVAAKIKKACGLPSALKLKPMAEPTEAPLTALEADKPGSERWPVKTGQDPNRAKVGKNVLQSGAQLGAGIVEATIEELINLPRPKGLEDIKADPPQFKSVRDGQAEVTIWRIEATIIGVKHEKDGDYHLVLQSAAMKTLVAEIPTPTKVFIGDSPWLDNIREARAQVDDKIVKQFAAQDFTLMDDKYVPHGAMQFEPGPAAPAGMSFTTPAEGSGRTQPLFQAAVKSTPARITGVGFFDRSHGATGAAPNVIELHPVLKVEWL